MNAGLKPRREDLAISRMVTRNASRSRKLVPGVPLMRDILVTNMEYILVRDNETS